MSIANRELPSLEDIEQYHIARWVEEQLGRLELLVRENGADDEMLRLIEYLLDENERWDIPRRRGQI